MQATSTPGGRLGAWLALLLILATAPCFALNPARRLTQYAHTAWRIEDGAFGATPNTLAQTKDGYLWIGTDAGLVRFDGNRFVQWEPPAGQRLLNSSIFSLRGASDGSLWIGSGSALSRWRNGRLTNYTTGRGHINAIEEDADGNVWFARSRPQEPSGPICRTEGDKVRCFGRADGVPFSLVVPMKRDRNGDFWGGAPEGVFRWRPGFGEVHLRDRVPAGGGLSGVSCVAVEPGGVVWAGIENSGTGPSLLKREHGVWTGVHLPAAAGSQVEVMALLVDSHGAVWVGTTAHGLYRLQAGQIEHYGPEDGLSSASVNDFLEDREGNLWIATSNGLDRLRDLQITTYSIREGLTAEKASSILGTRDGKVWIGNGGALESIQDGRILAIQARNGLPGRRVTSLLEDPAGRLWVGVDGGLFILDGGRFRNVPGLHGPAFGTVWVMAATSEGDVWAEVIAPARRLVHIRNERAVEEFEAGRVPAARGLASAGGGALWLGLQSGELARLKEGQLARFALPAQATGDPLPVREVVPDTDGSVWISNPQGLIRWKNGVARRMGTANGLPCSRVNGHLRDPQGRLWILSECGLLLLTREEVERWWAHPDAILQVRTFDALDGARPGPAAFAPSITRSTDGRIWFVSDKFVQVLDPATLDTPAPSPPVHIEQTFADRRPYAPRQGLELPALTRELQIDYTAVCLALPQKVRFRYMLEGQDTAWQEPGTRRQAFYSRLGPGTYRFRVMASNPEGVWNEAGDSLSFSIRPAYYQTHGFQLAIALLLLGSAWLGYRFRIRQIAAGLNARFAERLSERTRLARELHDTLLQTIQGSRMVADDALSDPEDTARMRRALEKLSGWLAQATREGRATLNELRVSTTQTNDLADGLRQAAEEAQMPASMQVVLSVEGEVKQMHPILRDELYRIGCEAIRNAVKHSGGSKVQVELNYGTNLELKVRDNGKGIPREISERGREGHFGLATMQERAERIGGRLRIFSTPGAGAEVQLVVPGQLLYTEPGPARSRLTTRLSHLLRRGKPPAGRP
ncbi:ligand-binding sensor domain-containing protein [Paludibaculum fermentans]|uniref:ligand-binding sensor domain-containing protein n=1 Tax=Paludibaculum fermentans TaxID=1473598 RepID=UPI003EBF78BF